MQELQAGKAITLMQPTTTLLAHGLLRYETRTWATKHRGLIYLHAAAKAFQTTQHVVNAYVGHCFGERYRELEYPTSAIVAKGELVGCHELHNNGAGGVWLGRDGQQVHIWPSDPDYPLGHFRKGFYAWEIRNLELLETPIPAKGKQGLWLWEPEGGR